MLSTWCAVSFPNPVHSSSSQVCTLPLIFPLLRVFDLKHLTSYSFSTCCNLFIFSRCDWPLVPLFPCISIASGFLPPIAFTPQSRVISKHHGYWRFRSDLICQSVHHHTKQEQGNSKTWKNSNLYLYPSVSPTLYHTFSPLLEHHRQGLRFVPGE